MKVLKSKLRKLMSIPFRIALKKLFYQLFKQKSEKKIDFILQDFLQKYNSFSNPVINTEKIKQISFSILEESKSQEINEKTIFKILSHQFNVLGDGDLIYNVRTENMNGYSRINWHKDFKANYTWDKHLKYNEIKIGDSKGADIKKPWELARLHQLLQLSLAYQKKPDLSIVTEYINQINDFIDENPPFLGVNWISPMEIAIRSVNIITSLSILFRSNVKLDNTFISKLSNYLYISAVFIYHKCEWSSGMRNNHYFANLIGLMVITHCFSQGDFIEDYGNFAVKEFLNEIDYQFNSDGSNFEGSLPYHFFMLEMLYIGLDVFNLNNKVIPNVVSEKLDKIITFSKNIRGLENFIPQIGDNDSGMVFKITTLYKSFNKHEFYDKILLHLLSNNYNDNGRKYLSQNLDYYSEYKDIGLITYQNIKLKLWISTGRKAQNGKGGHNHNDSLSFVLQVKSQEVICDPGTLEYTSNSKLRNLFRSAYSHNHFFIDNLKEFADDSIDDLFWYNDNPVEYKIEQNQHGLEIKMTKKILKNNIERKFLITTDNIQIIDSIPFQLKSGKLSLHFHPDVIDKINKVNNSIEIDDLISIHSDNDFQIYDYEYSPEYGERTDSKKIEFSKLKQTVITNIKIK
ncbi:MAG: hypothetical protein A2X64_10640 [Ignavibacteria bacterium GWF2_33_9]|nr:MAG: hypothetical protein A2X64_10640 [Ignavibacteria bacterium GWF2_33_9]